MKYKWASVGIAAVALVVIVSVAIFIQNRQKTATPQIQQTPEEKAVEMKPEDIGLLLTPNSKNTEVTMKISDVTKFTHFDYEMSYDAIVDGEAVPKGAIGSGDVASGDSTIEKKITIGTCSSGTCKYDLGVKTINFIIRLTLKDGRTAVVKKDLNLSGE